MSRSPLTERGGSLPGAGQGPRNYMQYNQGGSYDDDAYSLYASANYENERLEMQKEEPSRESRVLEFHRESRLPAIGGQKKGFEVINQEAARPAPARAAPAEVPQGGNYYACPVCSEVAVKACGCQYRDAGCANGHMWFTAGGKRLMGMSPGHAPQQARQQSQQQAQQQPAPARGVVYSE